MEGRGVVCGATGATVVMRPHGGGVVQGTVEAFVATVTIAVLVESITVAGRLASGVVQGDVVVGKVLAGKIVLVAGDITTSW